MEQRTVIPAMGLGGPAGAPRPQVVTLAMPGASAMGICTAWLGFDGKQRRTFTAVTAPNHPLRRLEEYSP